MRPLGRIALASHALPLAALALPVIRWPALVAWAAVQAGVTSEILRPGSRTFAPNFTKIVGAGNRLALTFDDGPVEGETPRLLDLLDEAGVTATFFLVGRRAAARPAIVKRIAASGHTIGNHTLTHPKHWSVLTRRRAFEEVGETQAILSGITGHAPDWFRPPMGHKNLHLEEILVALGLRQVTWSIRSFDTVIRDGERVASRVLPRARGGDIVLLHEGFTERRSDAPLSLAVLGDLLQGLRGMGLAPVSLEALLSKEPPAERKQEMSLAAPPARRSGGRSR